MSTNRLASPLGPLYGSAFFSTVMSTTFYGVGCMQTFFYYVHYENDPVRTKILVAILWTLNTVQEALCVAGAYKYIIAGLENPSSFAVGVPELTLMNLLTNLVAVSTEGFLIHRIYIFSGKNIILPLLFVVLAPIRFACAIVYVEKALYSTNGVHVVELSVLNGGLLSILGTLVLSFAACVNVLIAIFLTFFLVRHRMDADFARTAHLLQRLIVFAVNTGIWSATFSVLAVILLHLFPSNVIYSVFVSSACPIYLNTLLANLNARAYFRGEETTNNVNLDLFGNPDLRERGEANLAFAAH